MTDSTLNYHQYALDIQNGVIPACKSMLKTVERYFNDLQRNDIYLDVDEAKRIIHFCSYVTHFKGPLAGQPFTIEPWEEFILINAICWKWSNTGLRRFREAFILVPRKNGKSFLSSIVANYFLLMEQKQQDIACYAMNAQQARIVFDGAKMMVTQSKPMKKRSVINAHKMTHVKSNSRFEPVNSKAGGQEGRNDSIIICDELHTHPNSDMFDVMSLGTAARPESLHFIISTAGTDTVSFCKQLYDQFKTYTPDTTFTAIYELDEKKEIEDPSTWIKANPNLGVSVHLQEISDTIEKARAIPHRFSEVLTKRFNLWTQGEQQFIEQDDWNKCFKPGEHKPSNTLPVIIGIDLSSVSDISALWCVQPTGKTGEVRIWGKCYLPERALERGRKNADIYKQWVKRGWLTIAGDRTIDYEYIEKEIHHIAEQYQVVSVAFDPWNSNQMLTRLESEGVPVEKVRQGFITLSPATKALQTAVIQEKVIHDNNPILNWAIENVTLSNDAAGNIKPDKQRSHNKIDPVAALINAYHVWGLEEEQQTLTGEVFTMEW
ncbi:terminase large subunit [Vibrio parahaemolyticus]|nr:terminase large subunit [Vibrio parahaemolyticus]